ncbi:hypothetical protein EQH57_0249 [Dictyocoela roeselum]|nr:hypothetical protein EQH57_0249 [Dictyocoela roeselum]
MFKNTKNNSKFAIKELCPQISALETTGLLNDKEINLVFDTGSAYSYVDSKIVDELGIRKERVPEKVSITVDENKIVTDHESSFNIQVQGDKCNYYNVTARLLDNIPTDLILGVDFMKTNKAVINIEEEQ